MSRDPSPAPPVSEKKTPAEAMQLGGYAGQQRGHRSEAGKSRLLWRPGYRGEEVAVGVQGADDERQGYFESSAWKVKTRASGFVVTENRASAKCVDTPYTQTIWVQRNARTSGFLSGERWTCWMRGSARALTVESAHGTGLHPAIAMRLGDLLMDGVK